MLKAIVFGLVMVTAACATDDDGGGLGGGGGGGGGGDVLPKRGELASDPTIVSVEANCNEGGSGSAPYVWFRIQASDPMGNANLGGCAAKIGTVVQQDEYYGEGVCRAEFKAMACTSNQPVTVQITVSNATGGVTTAALDLVMQN